VANDRKGPALRAALDFRALAFRRSAFRRSVFRGSASAN
jgi:hypothetical protein